ncbi:NAD(P)H-dependent oxidoreductase subunit E, partial [bacterium]|nr:NAD(P)H-dependent oxidoreductase subunit E [bacterium]MBU1917514.1 NAD(P)H-dependent oxidoreductase subunit E [bacterium]
ADIQETMSFYHFFTTKPSGKIRIYVNNSVVACMNGFHDVVKAFEKALGCSIGSVTDDGQFGLFETSCIGMNDQEVAALINNIPFTKLTAETATTIANELKTGKQPHELVTKKGDGKNASDLIASMVQNNVHKTGPLMDAEYEIGSGLKKALEQTPEAVINEIKKANIRGRGGAGFPTGMKWEFCRKATGDQKYVFCNADEGEPGTFKDRVLLTEYPEMLFEGMAVAGYAIGATEGILYIRYEYKYLQKYLEHTLATLTQKNLLGQNILGKNGFNFTIRIQFGAGAYVCGEESALIESAEGKRGEPRDRPPFPVESGYLCKPTSVNNVETLCAVSKIIVEGSDWYKSFGTDKSDGTKILSISGDCQKPGIYEVSWGVTMKEILEMAGAQNTQAIQVGGPSGTLIGENEFNRQLSFEDLPTGGSFIIIGNKRDLLKDVVLNFTDFFIEESCGSCQPCRSLPPILKQTVEKIINGHGVKKDLDNLLAWNDIMQANRCGLGMTAANPIVWSIKNFRHLYEDKITSDKDYDSSFNLADAVKNSCQFVGRTPNLEGHHE